MSKITRETNIDLVKDDEKRWNFVSQFFDNIKELLNNGLKFSDNFDSKFVNVSFAAANIDTAVPHGLGRVPTGYIVTRRGASLTVVDGATAWTSNIIYLKSTAIGTVTVLVF